MMEVYANKDRVVVQKLAHERLASIFEQHKDGSLLFLTSGGSVRFLLENISLTGKCTVSVLDERFEGESNFAAIAQLPCTIIDPRPQREESVQETAVRFDDALHHWKEKNSQGIMVATMGIARDGHTAGIMPYPENPELFSELFEDAKKWVVGYDAKGKNEYPKRITATLPFLRLLDYAVVYAVGKEKRAALQRTVNRQGYLFQTPSRIIREMEKTFLYTDIVL